MAKAEKTEKAPKAPKAKKASTGINAKALDAIVSPVVTEKSTLAGQFGKYTFKVSGCASKTTIKQAVESIFGVNVTKINVSNFDGKQKVFKGRLGQRNSYRKAVVTLKQGQSIDLSSGIKI
jgi:large subunit ribosomal protein L23